MKITRIAAVGLIAATVSVAGFAGCGGSDSSSAPSTAADTTAAAPEMTEADFVAAATKVCTDVKAAEKTAQASLDSTNLQSLQEFVTTALNASKTALADLQGITPPAAMADAYSAYIAAQSAVVDAAATLEADVASATSLEDVTAKMAAATTDGEKLTAAADEAAVAAGLPECADN